MMVRRSRFAGLALVLGLAGAALSVACGGSDGVSCDASGTGTLVVNVVGLPAGVNANVTVTGPSGAPQSLSAGKTLTGIAGGSYTIAAEKVTSPDPIVRTVYSATISVSGPTCVATGATQTVTVTYATIPTSNKIWVQTSNGPDGRNTVGISSSGLAATGAPSAAAAVDTPNGRHVVFDRDGNLWSNGGTTVDPHVVRSSAASLASTGKATPDRKINIKGLEYCSGDVALAFDKTGALWFGASCTKSLYKLAPDQLAASGDYTPALTITVGSGIVGLAFDKTGNLWVGTGDSVVRYDASSLASSSATKSLELKAETQNPGGSPLHPGWLAFDASGNLWSNDFGGNIIFQFPAAELSGSASKTIVPPALPTLQVGALIQGMAFDEGGGLWITYSQGKFVRLTQALLAVTTNGGAPTQPERIISSPQVNYTEDLAFYPAPAALPLYSALP